MNTATTTKVRTIVAAAAASQNENGSGRSKRCPKPCASAEGAVNATQVSVARAVQRSQCRAKAFQTKKTPRSFCGMTVAIGSYWRSVLAHLQVPAIDRSAGAVVAA